MYDGLIQRFTNKINQHLSDIETIHNFEYGPEFEIALCHILRKILPEKYGICRGYIVGSATEEKIGDDIIIFDHLSFPTLRLLPSNDFSLKEQVPADAVYMYIEAKHNFTFDDFKESAAVDNKKNITFHKSLLQVSKAKNIVGLRKPRSLEEINDGFKFEKGNAKQAHPGWPDILNPFYTAIISRKVSEEVLLKQLNSVIEKHINIGSSLPDLMVIGSEVVVLPYFMASEKEKKKIVPFKIRNAESVICGVSKGNALAVGLCHILWALEHIKLKQMPWGDIFSQHLRNPSS